MKPKSQPHISYSIVIIIIGPNPDYDRYRLLIAHLYLCLFELTPPHLFSVLAVTGDRDVRRDERHADRHPGDGHLRHQDLPTPTSECPQCKHPSPQPACGFFYFYYLFFNSVLCYFHRKRVFGMVIAYSRSVLKIRLTCFQITLCHE